MNRALWAGLAVLNRAGRTIVWRGSRTPKLYHSEEDGRFACTDECTFEPAAVVRISLAELAELRKGATFRVAFTPREDRNTTNRKKQTFKPKRCIVRSCGVAFTPTNGRQRYCKKHPRGKKAA